MKFKPQDEEISEQLGVVIIALVVLQTVSHQSPEELSLCVCVCKTALLDSLYWLEIETAATLVKM